MEKARTGLQKIVGTALRRVDAAEAPLLAWPFACGTDVAQRTRALGFESGVLTVQVPDAGWRSQLQSLATQYRSLIHEYTGQNIERIQFVLPNAQDRK